MLYFSLELLEFIVMKHEKYSNNVRYLFLKMYEKTI